MGNTRATATESTIKVSSAQLAYQDTETNFSNRSEARQNTQTELLRRETPPAMFKASARLIKHGPASLRISQHTRCSLSSY